MSKLRVVSPVNEKGDATTSQNTKIYIDGNEVQGVASLNLRWAVREPIRADIEMYAAPDELVCNADVVVVCETCSKCDPDK